MLAAAHRLDVPVELEREIFEIAAKADIGTALRLAVVARRVQAWVEPIIYSYVIVAHAPEVGGFQTQQARAILAARRSTRGQKPARAPKVRVLRFIRTIPSRPTSFFARHVKRLHVGQLSEPELLTVLTTCTGITELGWWSCVVSAPVALALTSLTLHRLSIDDSFDFQFPATPSFATLTHLDITFQDTPFRSRLPRLETFPALTHFSVAYRYSLPPPTWCDDVLKGSPRLKILLVFSDRMYYDQIAGLCPRHADPRVVVMIPPVGDWTTRWVHDAWPLAEDVVRERQKRIAAEKDATVVDQLTA
ncbi:hypothetical protein FB451DRAFT_78597 [Mycena latifolia]|nr:hypothetical protein FB451DRAFT_78597 [Mycena latifolia]